MAVIQISVPDGTKFRADEAFKRCGITTSLALELLVYRATYEDNISLE